MTQARAVSSGMAKKAKDLGALLSERAYLARSELYRWLRLHHAELSGPLSAPRPPWKRLADLAVEKGIKGRDGPPTPGTVRAAWGRVQRDLQNQPAVSPDTGVGAAPETSGLGSRAKVEPPSLDVLTPEHEFSFDIKPAVFRGHAPGHASRKTDKGS